MVESAFIISGNNRKALNVSVDQWKLTFPLADEAGFVIEITFDQPIASFRNHDYSWVDLSVARFAGMLAPKVIRLKNGCLVQANISAGYWEIKNHKTVHWHFNTVAASPLTFYEGISNAKNIIAARSHMKAVPALLFSFKYAVEFSRSKIPFSAVACFTDHCDFDTLESLKLQRDLFKLTGVRVTKGFFLHHYSKRRDNASWQNDSGELQKWRDDGHELAYHSLSQSIKPLADSLSDYRGFEPPFADVTTYIDHGYQPYNLSLYRSEIRDEEYASVLGSKNISLLWNYIDSGTAASGIINQVNPYHFTLGKFSSAVKHLPLKIRIAMLLRNAVFHHDGSREVIRSYMGLASGMKNLKKLRIAKFPEFTKDFVRISSLGLKLLFNWKELKNMPFRMAKAAPVVFAHEIAMREFSLFQTIEMTDFKSALSKRNIDSLIDENGLFIAHTYFSAPMKYHFGRMFKNANRIDDTVSENFKYLGDMIKAGKIWNPTVNELADFLSHFQDIECDVDADGTIYVKCGETIHRPVS